MTPRKKKPAGAVRSESIRDLYRLPLTEFTAARNALAAELKNGGDVVGAAAIGTLAKPVRTAWIVNQLFWRHGRAFERLIDAGIELRRIQGTGDPASMREVADRRRKEIAGLLERAETIHGGDLNPSVERRLEQTLEAIATYGDAGPEQQLGCMTADLDPPGFDALLFVAPPQQKTRRGARRAALPEIDPRKIARARVLVDKARRELERRKAEAARQAAVRAGAEERVEETREIERAALRGLQMARNRIRRAEQELERAQVAAEKAAAVADRSAGKLADAEAALREAGKPVRDKR